MKWRNFLSVVFMLLYSLFLMAIGSMSRLNGWDGQTMILTALFWGFMASIAVWAVWNLEIRVRNHKNHLIEQNQTKEKRKISRLDAVLRDLSDEDLIRLRQRLADKSINDDLLYEHIMDTDEDLREKDY